MYRSARMAYESGSKTSDSSRELEANALFRAARRLEACQQDWNSPERAALLGEALRNNQKLWTLFQSALAEPGNPLPAELKVNLLRLSAFIDRRTLEILAAPTPEKLQALIDIDRNVAAGLAQRPSAPSGQKPQAAAGGRA